MLGGLALRLPCRPVEVSQGFGPGGLLRTGQESTARYQLGCPSYSPKCRLELGEELPRKSSPCCVGPVEQSRNTDSTRYLRHCSVVVVDSKPQIEQHSPKTARPHRQLCRRWHRCLKALWCLSGQGGSMSVLSWPDTQRINSVFDKQEGCWVKIWLLMR